MPSTKLGHTGLFMATDSTRASTMQLVTIKNTYTESRLLVSGAKALRSSSTTTTKVAMTTICTIRRMLVGMRLRISEMAALAKPDTAITAAAISNDGRKPTVTANAEQMPSACTVIGLRASNGSNRYWRTVRSMGVSEPAVSSCACE